MRERKKPTLIQSLTHVNVISLSAGSLHNACVTSDSCIFTWGCNDDHALGREGDEWLPSPVEGPLGKQAVWNEQRIKQVCCGASHTIALLENGEVYCWGTYRDSNGVLGFSPVMESASSPVRVQLRDPVVCIAAGENHDVVLTARGEVYQWGDIGYGQTFTERHKKKNKLTPTLVRVKKTKQHPGTIRLAAVYAGGASSFAVTKEGRVFSWGPNNYGQTGHRNSTQQEEQQIDETIPSTEQKQDEQQAQQPAKKRKTSRSASAAATTAYGERVLLPSMITELTEPIIMIAAAVQHTLFLTASHIVYAVGKNEDGRLGLGHNNNINLLTRIPSLTDVVDIATGEAHSLFVTRDGHLYSCGMGELLQLGNGVEEDLNIPTRVESAQLDKEDRAVIAASGGSQHSIILAKRRRTTNTSAEQQ